MLTLDDREYLQETGLGILTNIAGFGTSSLFYGVFLLMFPISAWKFYSRGVRTLPAWASFGITIVCFALASSYWIAYAASISTYQWFDLVDFSEESKLDSLYTRLYKLDLSCRWTRQLIQLLADGVVVWRAWVVCSRHRWLMVLPCALLLGTCAASFAYLSLVSTEAGTEDFIDGGKMRTAVHNAQGALSLLTNASATSVIGYKLWCFRRDWKLAMGDRSSWSRTQSVLLMVAESGATYAIYQLITVVGLGFLVTYDTPLAYFESILYESHVQNTAMYPTIVYLIVHNAMSIEDLQTAVWNSEISSR